MSSIMRNDQHTRWRFRDEPEDFTDLSLEETDDVEIPGIRCPLCKWRPRRIDMWTCWDVDHPEYFYGGCGTSWNTFATEGICPTCLHQWMWTSCLRCFMWSRHEDWYENEAG